MADTDEVSYNGLNEKRKRTRPGSVFGLDLAKSANFSRSHSFSSLGSSFFAFAERSIPSQFFLVSRTDKSRAIPRSMR